MSTTSNRVLDVGNCNADSAAIRAMLERHFAVGLDRVMYIGDAIEKMRNNRYDLVLVNRLIFEDDSQGLELVRRAKSDAAVQSAPIMMLSNHADAQATAVAEGAVAGFGKANIDHLSTVELLGQYLQRIPANRE